MGIFSRRSKADNSAVLGSVWPNYENLRYIMVVLVTCKNEEDQFTNEGARVLTTLNINFSDAQGQPWWDLAEFQTHPDSNGCPNYLQE